MTPTTVFAADKPEEKKEGPRIVMVTPFSVIPGKANVLRIRGMKLGETSSVQLIGGATPIEPKNGASGSVIPGENSTLVAPAGHRRSFNAAYG